MSAKWHCVGEKPEKRLCGGYVGETHTLDVPHFNRAVCVNDNSLLCQRCLKRFIKGERS